MTFELGDAVGFSAALTWAITTILARYQSHAIPAIWYNTFRTAFGSLTLLVTMPLWLGRTELSSVNATVLALLFGSVIAGYAIGDTACFESLRRIGVARASTISGCHPLITALLAVLFLGEPVTLSLIAGILVITFGVWLVTTDRPDTSGPATYGKLWIGVALSLVAAIGWACSTVVIRPAVQQIDAALASAIRMPLAAVVLFLLATRSSVLDSRRVRLDRRTAPLMVFAGAFSAGSAMLFLWGIDLLGAARMGAIAAVVPIFSAAIAVPVLGERLTPRLLVGMVISVGGVVLILLRN